MIERKNIDGILIARKNGICFARFGWELRKICQQIYELNCPGNYKIQKINPNEIQTDVYIGLAREQPVVLESIRKSQDTDRTDNENGIHWNTNFLISSNALYDPAPIHSEKNKHRCGGALNYIEHHWYIGESRNDYNKMLNKGIPLEKIKPNGLYKKYLNDILNDIKYFENEMITRSELYGQPEHLMLTGKIIYFIKGENFAFGKCISEKQVELYPGSMIASLNVLKESFKKHSWTKYLRDIRETLDLQENALNAKLLSKSEPMTLCAASSIVDGQYYTRSRDLLKVSIFE